MEHVDERQIVIFTLSKEEFGVDISEVREIIRMEQITKIPNTAPYVKGIINLRGSVVVIVDLAMKLGLQGAQRNDRDVRIIVTQVNSSTIGMIVDSATEVLRIRSDQVRPPPAVITERINAAHLQGVGIVGERLLILLDLAKVLESQEVNALERVQTAQLQAEKQATHETLQDVHWEWHFIAHDGRPLRNVHDLLEYATHLDDATFRTFVNGDKNDFANWIRHAVKDETLADRIQGLHGKDEVTREIRDRILSLILASDKA